MRPRRKLAAVADSGGIPACLLAGRCVEVWVPEDPEGGAMVAFRRWADARDWWLYDAGVSEQASWPRELRRGAPWSFEFISLERPDDLPSFTRDLPPRWRPADSVAEAADWIARGPARMPPPRRVVST